MKARGMMRPSEPVEYFSNNHFLGLLGLGTTSASEI